MIKECLRRGPQLTVCLAAVLAGCLLSGCPKQTQQTQQQKAPAGMPAGQQTQYCDFKAGPDDAKVKVTAFYPGRHEDTLAAVKSLVDAFPGKVQIEVVDWRRPEGLKRRDETGLVCAGVVINDKNAFDLEINGQKSKVLFVRGMDGEWTKADLEAAVKQELAVAK